MPHIELTAIARKINDTEEAIKNIAQCSDVNMRAIMTSELERRLSNLQEQKKNGAVVLQRVCFPKNIR